MRSALDHIVWAPTSKQTQERGFPIQWRDDAKAFDTTVEGMPDAVRDVIKSFQPHHSGDQARFTLLCALHDLDTIGKHHETNFVTGAVEITGGRPPGTEIRTGSLKHRDIFARVPADVDVEKDFEPRISFPIHILVSRPRALLEIAALRGMLDLIRDDVLPAITRAFAEGED